LGRRSDINWPAVQADYALGALPVRQIARLHGIAESNLRVKAEREQWTRGTGEAVREATREALKTASDQRARKIGEEIGAEQARRFEEHLYDAAMPASVVQLQHQLAARRGMDVAMRLLQELETATKLRDVIEAEVAACREDDQARAALIDRLLGLRALIESMDKWASACSKITNLEREAHGMNSEERRSDVDDLLLKIAAEREAPRP
jgi:hypothetical protein